MLLSLPELIVWTGLGPFEVALHSFGLLIFTCLTTLRLEGVISSSWHVIFSPLYVALGLHLYYLSVMSVRMAVWTIKLSRCAQRALACLIAVNIFGIGVFLYFQIAMADFLNNTNSPDKIDNLLTSLVILVAYLITRLVFVCRTLRSTPDLRDY